MWDETTTDFQGDNNRSRRQVDTDDPAQDMIIYLCLHDSCMIDTVKAKFRICVIGAGGKKERPSGYDEFVDFIAGRG